MAGMMEHEVELVTATPRATAVVPCSTSWEKFPSVWPRLLDDVYAFLRVTSDVQQTGHNVMLYLDDVPNVEVGVEVAGSFADSPPVVASSLPAGLTARTLHRGPYDQLEAAHAAIWAWCRATGREPVGARWEIYGDWHDDPNMLETEVFYLLGGRPANTA